MDMETVSIFLYLIYLEIDCTMIDLFKEKLREVKAEMPTPDFRKGNALYVQGQCQVLSQSGVFFEMLVEDEEEESGEKVVRITTDEELVNYAHGKKTVPWDSTGVAALMQAIEEYERTEPRPIAEGRAYTREGMIKRVMEERRERAAKADYHITFADNIHGEHTLYNERGVKYKITLRDFENETGYIDNPDLKTNKLGTTKHLMYAFAKIKENPERMAAMDQHYPFIEIYCDPLNDYRITRHYPHPIKDDVKILIDKYFGDSKCIKDGEEKEFLHFISATRDNEQVVVRPEVEEKVKRAWDEELLRMVREKEPPDFTQFPVKLFPYQEEGVRFATYRQGAIIADEMGLGKTIQAICTAVIKKQLFGFKRTLIVCPASLKEQWKNEIEKFSAEKAVVAEGFPEERAAIYSTTQAYFVIVNYETVLRDLNAINRMEPDFVVLDEAQRIKNFTTITARHIKKIKRKHALVITGTPIENKLIDLYSIVDFVDPYFLSPLWEFSQQHCYFDTNSQMKITGYYNLRELHERMKAILIRREKRAVLQDLPELTEMNVPVAFDTEQASMHANFANGVARILSKKFITPYDQQRLMLLLNNMRMVCDSTFLIDKETNFSPKLHELRYILCDKLEVKEKATKIIIFSEWVTMLSLISKMLREEGIGHVMLSGKVSVKNRGKLVEKFEQDPDCKIFLSSEAGGSGLNLQVADTVINFELPWNPAKKNQRIGRIDRLGQRSKNLTVINLITKGSFEVKIASGLVLKQNLFEGVLNENEDLDFVDFSASGRSQFLQQIEEVINGFTDIPAETDETIEEAEPPEELSLDIVVEEQDTEITEEENVPERTQHEELVQMEKVMGQGLDFLSGMIKMATGKDVGLEGNKIEVDKTTGEVTMKFKLPGW